MSADIPSAYLPVTTVRPGASAIDNIDLHPFPLDNYCNNFVGNNLETLNLMLLFYSSSAVITFSNIECDLR